MEAIHGDRDDKPGRRARQVNRSELRALIRTTVVPGRAFSLDGRAKDEALVLEPSSLHGEWAVYHAERGGQSGRRTFATEHEACAYFWDVFSRDVVPSYERWHARRAEGDPDSG